MRTAGSGIFVGIPLTLLQLCLHGAVPPELVANNFALGVAIYDADRIRASTWSAERLPSRLAAAASTAFFLSDAATQPLAPAVVALHAGYADVIKPRVQACKPFFVAALWTAYVYYVPMRLGYGDPTESIAVPAHTFLSIAALSHAADTVDVDDDRTNGIRTPAVLMGLDDARRYALLLALCAALVDYEHPARLVGYDLPLLVAVAGIVYEQSAYAVAIDAVILAVYCQRQAAAILASAILSSTGVHDGSIHALVWIQRCADAWDPRVRDAVLPCVFEVFRRGDAAGGWLLHVYEKAALAG